MKNSSGQSADWKDKEFEMEYTPSVISTGDPSGKKSRSVSSAPGNATNGTLVFRKVTGNHFLSKSYNPLRLGEAGAIKSVKRVHAGSNAIGCNNV